MLASAAALVVSLVLGLGVAGGPLPKLPRLANIASGLPMRAGAAGARPWQLGDPLPSPPVRRRMTAFPSSPRTLAFAGTGGAMSAGQPTG